ncbi:nuclease-related domain-containing protein [uncultured Treponema sp.]
MLSKLPYIQYRIINDVLLKTCRGITQIDHVVLSEYGIFVIETKNYSG